MSNMLLTNQSGEAEYAQIMPVGVIPAMIASRPLLHMDPPAVMIAIHSPMGVHTIVVQADQLASQIIPMLEASALQARSRLVVPSALVPSPAQK